MNVLSNFMLLAQQNGGDAGAAGAAAGGMFMLIVQLVILIGTIAGMWKAFEKAGKPGWASIIPIYNVIVLLEIAGKPLWWILLLFIPCVNFIVIILINFDVAKNFGKGAGFGIGLTFLSFIFWPMLGFGDAQYRPAS